MPHPPAELPREPYRALAVFFLLPLAAAVVGARRWAPDTADRAAPPAVTAAEASVAGPSVTTPTRTFARTFARPLARTLAQPRPPAPR